MTANDLLKQVYIQFYEQQQVLEDGPKLTQAPDEESFDVRKADAELAAVVSYLIAVPDVHQESFDHVVQIIQDHYGNQPEWKELLLQYLEYAAEKEKEELQAQEDALIKEVEAFTKKLLEEEQQ